MTMLRVGATETATPAMGPGLRFCIWVQGCHLKCRNCATPEFLDPSGGTVIEARTLVRQIRDAQATHQIQGLSISGGEPFLQAQSLAEIAKQVQGLGLSVISWSGYPLEFLQSPRAPQGSAELLKYLDVLIDGPFVEKLKTDRLPMRGSGNQRLHLLSHRYDLSDFEIQLEVKLTDDGNLVANGVIDTDPLKAILEILG